MTPGSRSFIGLVVILYFACSTTDSPLSTTQDIRIMWALVGVYCLAWAAREAIELLEKRGERYCNNAHRKARNLEA